MTSDPVDVPDLQNGGAWRQHMTPSRQRAHWRAGLALVALIAACGPSESERPGPVAAPEPPPPRRASGTTRIRIERADLRLAPDTVLRVERLDGRMSSTRQGEPPFLDDPESFRIAVDSARLSIDAASLSAMFNDCLRRHREVPLADVKMGAEPGELRQRGKLKKGPGIPFAIAARPEIGPGGRLLILRPTAIEAAHIPVKGLLRLLGLELESLLDLDGACGMTAEDDALLLDPSALAPPPQMTGRLTGVEVLADRLAMRFGDPPPPATKTGAEPGYLAFSGGTIRFGRLTMTDTDLRLIDADPSDPFDFYLRRYIEQLVPGHSKNTRDGGLRAYLVDYSDIDAAPQ